MVGGEDDDGVVGHARRVQRVEDVHDRRVDELHQVVVETPVRIVGRLLVEHLRPQVEELPLRSRTPGERVGLRRRRRDVGHGVVGPVVPQDVVPRPSRERDVVRVHERGDREPWPIGAVGRELREQLGDLFGVEAVLDDPAVRLRHAVWLAADPAGEAERIETIGAAVRVDRAVVDTAVRVVRRQALVGAGNQDVCVRDVPLAAVVRAVAGRAEPVAHRGHRARVEPRHQRVARLLGQAVGVGDAVQRRVLPGEQRRPAREARGRPGIVAVQFHAGGARRSRAGSCVRRNSARGSVS